MAETMRDFGEGSAPAQAMAVIPFSPEDVPIVVLVVDDSRDDDLVALTASAVEHGGEGPVSVPGHDGAWEVFDSGDHHMLRFRLERSYADGWARTWTYIDPPEEIVDAIAGGSHYVAILPRELAGDLTHLDVRAIAASLLVKVTMQPQDCAGVKALCGF